MGGFELEVLESYEVALPQGFMAWMMVIGNEDRQDRLPAAVGVICASDLNDVETRVLSPQEQQQINNVVQQFATQVTNIENVINIINNVTGNATTGPVTPPTNDTGGTTPPTGGVGPRPPGGGAGGIPENATITADTTPPIVTVPPSYTVTASGLDDSSQQNWVTGAEDDVDGVAILEADNRLRQVDDPAIGGNTVGGSITISCDPPSGSYFVVGLTTVQCTATDASGNTGTASFTIRMNRPPIESPFLAQEQEQPPAAIEEQPPVVEEEAPVEEQEPPAAEEEEEAAAPPANEAGGG